MKTSTRVPKNSSNFAADFGNIGQKWPKMFPKDIIENVRRKLKKNNENTFE